MSMKICEECGNVLGAVVGVIVLIVIVVAIAVGVNVMSSEDISFSDIVDTISDEVSDTSSEDKITLKKFNKIKTGMTYEQVVEIIGEEGTTLSEVDITGDEEYHTVTYYWYAEDGISNANVTIQGGKVISKAQIGLD